MTQPGALRLADREGFEQVVRQYGPLVLSVAESFTSDPDEVHDLFQDIWITVWAKRSQYSGEGAMAGWLMILARNVCRSNYRSEQSRSRRLERYAVTAEDSELAWKPADPHAALEDREQGDRLRTALLELSDREREAIVLRVFESRSPDEVSRIMGCKKATVRSLIRKAIHRLQELLRPEPQSEPNGTNGG